LSKAKNFMGEFSHLESSGKAKMVNVENKKPTVRVAVARAIVYLPDAVMDHFDGSDVGTKKGGVFQTAIIAGIMAAKRTAELIPMCHTLALDHCSVKIEKMGDNELHVMAEARIEAKTGVEMEALTAASVAALTIYDMCKGLSHQITIREIKLLSKSGGKNDYENTQ
jgi:cyclic pyranopterin phosphate synthase